MILGRRFSVLEILKVENRNVNGCDFIEAIANIINNSGKPEIEKALILGFMHGIESKIRIEGISSHTND